jgi:hypothetical protein
MYLSFAFVPLKIDNLTFMLLSVGSAPLCSSAIVVMVGLDAILWVYFSLLKDNFVLSCALH